MQPGFIEILPHIWYEQATGLPWSTKRSVPKQLKANVKNYPVVRINGINYLWHRLVWEHFNGPIPPGMEIDHIDGNPENPKKENLQLVTHRQNLTKQKKRKNSSGYKGVHWIEREGRWRSQIMKDGKTTHIGYFDDPIEAARAHDKKARELHGEFAVLNFP